MRVWPVVLACAAVLVPVASATASVTNPPRVGGISNSTSANWAGYAATGSTYHDISASWTQPAVTCAAGENSFSSFWVGLDGDTSKTVEQIGTSANCRNGIPTYSAWYEMYPKLSGQLPITINAGDSISASVSASTSGAFTLTLSVNGGTPQMITASNRRASLSSAEVITEAPSSNHGPFGTLPFADFGSVSFSNATVDGQPFSNSSPDAITMQSGTTVKAQPSSLSGGSFSVMWEHA